MTPFNPNNFTVLIIDDVPDNIEILSTFLEDEGYLIMAALSAKKALKKLENIKPDLILLDLFMPEINGIELCRLLKSNPVYQETPIIFLTASQDEHNLVEAFEAGAIDYITKPFNLSELLIRVRNHLELTKAKQEVQESARVKAQFLANMSHEIRTPMQGVLGITELLIAQEKDLKKLEMLQTLQVSGQHLLDIVNDILDFAKIENQEVKLEQYSFNLNSLFEEIIDFLLLNFHRKNINFVYFIDQDIPEILVGDPLRLRQILLNLISNAIKFTDQGDIIVKVSKESNHNYKFTVQDSGIGIKQEDQIKLFKSFSQVDSSPSRKYGGTGLGLAISKQLVELMGGKIGVESAINKGSIFWFTVNLGTSPQPQKPLITIPHQKVLILSKNKQICQLIATYCQKFFWTVAHFNYLNILPHYDLIFINDTLISEKTTLKKDNLESKFILLTNKKPENSSELVFDEYLIKPIKYSHLFDCLTKLIQEKTTDYSPLNNLDETPKLTSNNSSILLVEDTLINQKVVLYQLKELGYQADCANNGQECLEKLAIHNYDLILMDCQMPILDGYQTTETIRKNEQTKHQIIIGLTANAMKGDRQKCLEVGMDDYLSKPVDLEKLSNMLQKWLPKKINNLKKK